MDEVIAATRAHARQMPAGDKPTPASSAFSNTPLETPVELAVHSTLGAKIKVSGRWSLDQNTSGGVIEVPTMADANAFKAADSNKQFEMLFGGVEARIARGDYASITIAPADGKVFGISASKQIHSSLGGTTMTTFNTGSDPGEFRKAVDAIRAGGAATYARDILQQQAIALGDLLSGKIATPIEWTNTDLPDLAAELSHLGWQMQSAEAGFAKSAVQPARAQLKQALALDQLGRLFDKAPETMIGYIGGLAETSPSSLAAISEIVALGRDITGAKPWPLHASLAEQFGSHALHAAPRTGSAAQSDNEVDPQGKGSAEAATMRKAKPAAQKNGGVSAQALLALWQMSADAALIASLSPADYEQFAMALVKTEQENYRSAATPEPVMNLLKASLRARRRSGKASQRRPGEGWSGEFGAVPLPLLSVLARAESSRDRGELYAQAKLHGLEWLKAEKGDVVLHTQSGDVFVSAERLQLVGRWLDRFNSAGLAGVEQAELRAAFVVANAKTTNGSSVTNEVQFGHFNGPGTLLLRAKVGERWLLFNEPSTLRALAASSVPIYREVANKAYAQAAAHDELARWRRGAPLTAGIDDL